MKPIIRKVKKMIKTQTSKVIYVMGAPAELMDKIRREADYWAEGDENICMNFDQAMEIEELVPFLKERQEGCDVIVSK